MIITTWQDEHPIRPDPASGMYVRPDGRHVFPAKRLIEWAYPVAGEPPPRCRVVRGACATHARHVAGRGPAVNLEAVPEGSRQAVAALVNHKLWERLEVLGAPVHTAFPNDEIGTTIDLLVRFRESGGNGIAALHTAPAGSVRIETVMAELGVALYTLGDVHKTIIEKAFVIWARPEKVELQMLDPEACCLAWMDAVQLSRWQQQRPELLGQGWKYIEKKAVEVKC